MEAGLARGEKKLVLSEDHEYVLIRLRNGDDLRYCQGVGHRTWWQLGKATDGRTVDDATVRYLERRGFLARGEYQAGRFHTPYTLTDAGRELAAGLAAVPPPGYLTPKERRDAAYRGRLADQGARRQAAWDAGAAKRSAERAVLDAVEAYFEQRGSFDALEDAYLKLRSVRDAGAGEAGQR